jgi:hypothetical protein
LKHNLPIASFAKANKFEFQGLTKRNNFAVDAFAEANKLACRQIVFRARNHKFEFQVLPRQNKSGFRCLTAA